jgi:hypothetical protein
MAEKRALSTLLYGSTQDGNGPKVRTSRRAFVIFIGYPIDRRRGRRSVAEMNDAMGGDVMLW